MPQRGTTSIEPDAESPRNDEHLRFLTSAVEQSPASKEVGKGTGQGLSIAHSVIVQKHGGTLTFETEVGRGTTFFVRLPLGAAM